LNKASICHWKNLFLEDILPIISVCIESQLHVKKTQMKL
jgi:hypothetical protein